MKLTVYYDGQFWVGVIEVVNDGKLRAIRLCLDKSQRIQK